MIKGNMKNIIISVILSIGLLSMPFQTAIYTQFAQATDGESEDESSDGNGKSEDGDDDKEEPDKEFEDDSLGRDETEQIDGESNTEEENGDGNDESNTEEAVQNDKEDNDTGKPNSNENNNEEESTENEDADDGKGTDLQDPDNPNEEQDLESKNYEIVVNDVYETTETSARISWTTKSIDEEYAEVKKQEVYVDDELIYVNRSGSSSYDFKNLVQNETYTILIRSYITDDYFVEKVYEYTFDWRYHPVQMNIKMNGHLEGSEGVLIRGLDESNADYKLDVPIGYFRSREFLLPVGELSVVLYDIEDLSVSNQQTITVDENVNYIKKPLEVVFDVKKMKEDANPFEYVISDIEEDSFTISWTDAPKLEEMIIKATNEEHDEEIEVTLGATELSEKTYTFTGLRESITYAIEFIKRFTFGLEEEDYFNLKTDGEDARGEKVEIPDEELLNSLIKTIGLIDREITKKDLENLNELSVYSYDRIETLEGLEYATGLTKLWIEYEDIDNIDSIKDLINLRELHLSSNQLSNIEGLANLVNLWELDLSYNEIEDFSPLKGLTDLEILHLDHNEITDLTNLENLTNLQYLSLGSNQLHDLAGLESLTNLEELYLAYNEISDVSALKNLHNLTDLSIGNNHISDLSALKDLHKLTRLSLYDNNITDINDLSGLTSLSDLDVSNNRIVDISTISNLTNLESLDLSDNRIKQLPDMSGLSKLGYLNLANNPLIDISNLKYLIELSFIDLSGTDLDDLSVLLELRNLWRVDLFKANVSDTATIELLKERGVEVNVGSGYGKPDGETDWEEVHEVFSNHQLRPDINKANRMVQFKLDNNDADSVSLTSEQVQSLLKNELTLELLKNEVTLTIPHEAFGSSDAEVKIIIEDLGKYPNTSSNVYDLKIIQDGNVLSEFPSGIKLTFEVDLSQVENPDRLAVYHLNERKNRWNRLSSTHHNGFVTATTTHFSKFAVLEAAAADLNDDNSSDDNTSQGTVDDSGKGTGSGQGASSGENDDSRKNGGDGKDKLKVTVAQGDQGAKADGYYTSFGSGGPGYLPRTATGMFNLVFAGAFLVLSGTSLLILNRMRKRAAEK